MTDTFARYAEDFELYRDDAAKDTRAISSASSPGARSFIRVNDMSGSLSLTLCGGLETLCIIAFVAARNELIERAEGNLSEADRNVGYVAWMMGGGVSSGVVCVCANATRYSVLCWVFYAIVAHFGR
jgi:hypothetical protein